MFLIDLGLISLFFTDLWIILYLKLLIFLNRLFPAKINETFLWVPSVPEPFEIPLYLGLTMIFVLLIFISQRFEKNLSHLPLKLKFIFTFLLAVLFLTTLGKYPMNGEYDPYLPRANGSIYLLLSLIYLTVAGFLVFISKYLKSPLFYLLILIVIITATFDAGFPIAGHDYEYFIGPSYEIAQGKTVYTDILSRYAFLTVDLFALFNKVGILNLFYLPFLVWLLYIAQYFLCFVLIKKISRSNRLAVLGTISIMTFNYFSLSHLPSVIPQIGPLRWFPLILLLFLHYKIRNLESIKFIFTAAFLSFFMIDVGLAIFMAYGTTLFLQLLQGKTTVLRIVKAGLLSAISLIIILLTVNLIHLLLGYKTVDIVTPFYSFRKHALLGLSMIPIKEKNYFWFVLLVYFASIIYFFRQKQNEFKEEVLSGGTSGRVPDDAQRGSFPQRASAGRKLVTESDKNNNLNIQLLLLSANLSLFASVYFVGRSHPHNLFNISLLPLLNLFILFGIVFKNKFTAYFYLLIFISLIVLPAYQRRFTLTEMLITKYTRFTAGNIFKSEAEEIIDSKYKEEIKMIKNNFPGEATILSADDTYLFYATGKKNLLDANPILGIDLPEDLDFAVKNLVKKCPEKIAVDCSFIGKCPPYTPFVGVNFDIKLILAGLETGCKSDYIAHECGPRLCIADKQKK